MVGGDCCALVVREEYWERQLKIYLRLRGITLSQYQLERLKVSINNFIDKCIDVVYELKCIAVDIFGRIYACMKGILADMIRALLKFVEECEVSQYDDFVTICDKLENRMLYLNRQECIRQEQYFKAQFKLAKMNYNIMNHDRRC